MDKNAQIQAKKAALATKIEQQQQEIRHTLLELRAELEPLNMLKNALGGMLPASAETSKQSGASGVLNKGLPFVLDLLVRDPRVSILLKSLAPLAIRYWTKRKEAAAEKALQAPEAETDDASEANEPRRQVLSRMREGVSSLRKKLKKPKTESDQSELPEN